MKVIDFHNALSPDQEKWFSEMPVKSDITIFSFQEFCKQKPVDSKGTFLYFNAMPDYPEGETQPEEFEWKEARIRTVLADRVFNSREEIPFSSHQPRDNSDISRNPVRYGAVRYRGWVIRMSHFATNGSHIFLPFPNPFTLLEEGNTEQIIQRIVTLGYFAERTGRMEVHCVHWANSFIGEMPADFYLKNLQASLESTAEAEIKRARDVAHMAEMRYQDEMRNLMRAENRLKDISFNLSLNNNIKLESVEGTTIRLTFHKVMIRLGESTVPLKPITIRMDLRPDKGANFFALTIDGRTGAFPFSFDDGWICLGNLGEHFHRVRYNFDLSGITILLRNLMENWTRDADAASAISVSLSRHDIIVSDLSLFFEELNIEGTEEITLDELEASDEEEEEEEDEETEEIVRDMRDMREIETAFDGDGSWEITDSNQPVDGSSVSEIRLGDEDRQHTEAEHVTGSETNLANTNYILRSIIDTGEENDNTD